MPNKKKLSPRVWAIKEIDRRRRAFIWAGADTVSGGKCKVAWPAVCMPKDLGGLGLPDLSTLGVALRLRWEWLRRSDPSTPWAQLPFKMDAVSEAMFSASARVVIGDGTRARFWTDSWLPNGPICLQAPSLFRAVGPRRRGRSVRDALLNGRWRHDVTGARTMAVISEFAAVWDICLLVVLHPGVPDQFIWKWTADGEYSAASAYRAFFFGSTELAGARELWAAPAPPPQGQVLLLVGAPRQALDGNEKDAPRSAIQRGLRPVRPS